MGLSHNFCNWIGWKIRLQRVYMILLCSEKDKWMWFYKEIIDSFNNSYYRWNPKLVLVLVHKFPTTFQTIHLEAEYVNFWFAGKQGERMWTNDPHYWSHFWVHKPASWFLSLYPPLQSWWNSHLLRLKGSLTKIKYSYLDEICHIIDHIWWYFGD